MHHAFRIFGIVLILLGWTQASKAATEIGSARVEIVPAITLIEDTSVDFGRLSNVDGTCAMAADGSLSGSQGMDCVGTQTPGVFSISGAVGSIINISVTQGALGGITFTPVIAGNSQRTLTDGTTSVTILGSLTLAGASEGSSVISYTVIANYE